MLYTERYSGLREYAEFVADLNKDGSAEVFPNDTFDHAAIVIENIFSGASDTVCIFSGQLQKEIYYKQPVLDQARNFLKHRSGKILVLLQDFSPEDGELKPFLTSHPFIHLCRKYKNQCKFSTVNELDRNIKSHFVVMDSRGFRFCRDKIKPAAIASFNQPNIAKNLSEQFFISFERGTPLSFAA